jgi:hypothetical protein
MKHMIAAMFTLIGLAFTTGALAAGPLDGCPPGWHDVCADDGGDVICGVCVPILHEERGVVRPGEDRGDVTPGEPSDGPEELYRTPLCESGYYSICDIVDGDLVCSCKLEEV